MFNQAGEGRFSLMLSRLFRVQGGGSVAPTVAPEVMPVTEVNSIDPTVKYLIGIRRCAIRQTVAAVAAQSGMFELNNPAGSGMLVTLKRVFVFQASPSILIYFSRTGSGFLSSTRGALQDSRLYGTTIGSEASQALLFAQASGTIAADNKAAILLPPAISAVEVEWVLDPGSFLGFQAQTNNVAVSLAFEWEERKLNSEESRVG